VREGCAGVRLDLRGDRLDLRFSTLLITKTFWSLRSSSRHETLSGERIAKYNCVFAQSSSQRHLDVKLMFDNLGGRLRRGQTCSSVFNAAK